MIPSDSHKANELVVQQLRSFCLVFEQRSYSAAAREIERSVPTLWEQVRAVERRYGVVLFQRHGRRIEPTQAAELLYASLGPLLAGLDSTFEQMRELQSMGPATVTLIAGVRMLCEELGEPLRRFHEQYPQVSLHLLHGDDETAVRMVADGTADLALTLERGPDPSVCPVSSERAYAIDYLAIFLPEHPLKRIRSLRLRHLVQHPLVMGHHGTSVRALFEQALHREDLLSDLKITAETDNSAFTIACVRAGLGVGIAAGRTPASSLTYNLETRSLSHLLGRAHIAFRRKKGRQPTKVVHALMNFISETLA